MNAIKHPFFLLMSLGLFALSGWYLAGSTPKFILDSKTLLTTTDTRITQLHLQQYDAAGKPSNRLISPLVRHVPQNNTHWIKSPQIILTQPNQAPWEIHADEAKAIHGGEEITLMHHVWVHQAQHEQGDESTFTTEHITYYPKTKLAVTAEEILFEQPGKQVQAKGMRADLEKKHIHLLHQARGIYDPKHG